MTFDKLRVSIFEAYQNDEISRETCQDMLESVLNMEGNHIVAEGEAIRSDFMNVALECANGNVEFTALEKKAETFGEKVKAVWEKFKAWVKKIVDGIKNKLFPKKSVSIRISEGFDKALDKASQLVNAVAANADFVKIAEALLGVATAAGAIFAGKKFVTKRADDIHKKILKVSTGFQKLVDKIYSKLPPKIQESGIMKAIREWLGKLQTADTQVTKAALKQLGTGGAPAGAKALPYPGQTQPSIHKRETDQRVDNKPTKSDIDDHGYNKTDAEDIADDNGAWEPPTDDDGNVIAASAHSDFADGDMFGESTGDFDLDAMLAELGI